MPDKVLHPDLLFLFRKFCDSAPGISFYFYDLNLDCTSFISNPPNQKKHKNPPFSLLSLFPESQHEFVKILLNSALEGKANSSQVSPESALPYITCAPLYSEKGSIVGGVLISQIDINQAERNNPCQKLQWVLESIAYAVVTIDKEFSILSCNQYFIEQIEIIFRKKIQVGDNYMSVFMDYPPMYADIRGLWNRVFQGEAFSFIRHLPPPLDLYIEIQVTPLRDDQGNITGGTNVMRNVTVEENNKRALQEQQSLLAQNEEKLRVLFRESLQNVYLITPEGDVYEKNRHKNKPADKSAPHVKLWDLKEFTQPPETPTILKSMTNRAMKGEEVRFEIDARTEKNKLLTYDFSLKPVPGNNHAVSMIIGEARDITELRRARDELEKTRIQQVRDRQLEEFAWMTSHNLRSPAGNLSVLINLLEKAETPSEKQFISEKMRQAVANLMTSIDILAETVKIRQKSGQIKTEIYFEEVLDTVKDSLSGLILESGAVIYSDFTACDKILYFREYLRSILQNLLSNALKYRSPDRPLRITITSGLNASRPVLIFADNGSGIDLRRHSDKIFGLYKTFHRNHDSQGIGLFLVRNQVEAAGGHISVESEVDKGTVFKINF